MIKVARALQNISSLTALHVDDNDITEEAADDIAAVILCNRKLQLLGLSKNYLKTAGMIKLSRALQKISSLTILLANSNDITDQAADDIAAVVQSNSNLRVLGLSDNMLQATGAIKIAQAVQEYNKSSFLSFTIFNNRISKEAKDKIKAILSNNLKISCYI